MTNRWQRTLQEYRAKDYLVFAREDLAHISLENLIANTSASPSTQMFLRRLADPRVSLWDAFVQSIQCVQKNLQEDDIFAPLKRLIEHATHLAVLYGEEDFWKSPDKWSYLVEIGGLWESSTPGYVLFHPPASLEHIKQAEVAIGLSLPPTFVRFLFCTNGLGIGTYESWYINGTGKARAFWSLLAEWNRPSYHEIASEWWCWQDLYAYERQRDQEEGIIDNCSDEQVSIPFAYGADAWCFDRSHCNKVGEYTIFYWDHELRRREKDLEYPSFEAWFLDNIIRGELFEEREEEDS